MNRFTLILILLITFSACKNETSKPSDSTPNSSINSTEERDSLIYAEETHFKAIRQVTFGGDNAEAYWSFDDKQLVFQSNNAKWNVGCDQMFLMNANETFTDSIAPPMLSTGKGTNNMCLFLAR